MPLRIGVVVPPMLAVPPVSYAGTERVVGQLVDELCSRGHAVTLFAAGDSTSDCELVPVIPRSLWSIGYLGDPAPYIDIAIAKIWQQHARFEVIHAHVETSGFLFARHCPTPVVTTLHGRLDTAGTPELMTEFTDTSALSLGSVARQGRARGSSSCPEPAEPEKDVPGRVVQTDTDPDMDADLPDDLIDPATIGALSEHLLDDDSGLCSLCGGPLGYSTDDQPFWPTGPMCGDCYQARQMDDELAWSDER